MDALDAEDESTWEKDHQVRYHLQRDLNNRKQTILVSKLRLIMHHSFDAFDGCNNDSNNIGMVKSVKIFGKYSGDWCTYLSITK